MGSIQNWEHFEEDKKEESYEASRQKDILVDTRLKDEKTQDR